MALKKSQARDSAQIRREARIGAGLYHPHVVTVLDAVTDGADRWLVMEYLPSRNLSEILRADGGRCRRSPRPGPAQLQVGGPPDLTHPANGEGASSRYR